MEKGYALIITGIILSFILLSTVAYGYETTWPWPIYRCDQSRSGYSPVSAPDTNATLWTWEVSYGSLRTPIIANGIVYTVSYDDLYALDETTGVELWHVQVGTSGAQITGGPTFADGKLYVGTYDGYVYCLNSSNGQQIWYWPTGTAYGRVETSPVVANGKVYFGTADYSYPSEKNYLVAVNANTGVQVWRYTGVDNKIRASPAVDGTWIFFASDNGKVYALNDTGSSFQLKWSFTTSSSVLLSTPCISGDKVIFGTHQEDHSIFALNKTTGDIIWQYILKYTYSSIDNSVAVANNIVYFTPSSGWSRPVYALNASASPGTYNEGAINEDEILIWKCPEGYLSSPCNSPAITNDKLIVRGHYILYVLNIDDGTKVWSYDFVSGQLPGEPVIADGRIFITQAKKLFCFGDFYPANRYNYPVNVAGHDYIVEIAANATCTNFNYSALLSEKKLTYTLKANWINDETVISNITVPNEMLGGPYTVIVDGGETPINEYNNGTHTTIGFTYLQLSHGSHIIEITGTTVVPEFPQFLISTLLIVTALTAIILKRKKV